MPLTLTRKPGESIQIGDDIHITVDYTDNAKISVTIDAPKSVKIVRSELLEPDEDD